ncbi:MAG: exodeoxyribonuclease VII small subunit [Candidatus Omnitrophica bacterium]|nr:exodeoxyribonuclease VII small subunit [Candidatus Omnitrophota bacterium]
MSETKEIKYEDALKRLEKLVGELDGSDLDLETRLKRFEEGTKLARILVKRLEQAKKKVQILVKTHVGEASLASFDDDVPSHEREPGDDETA